MRKIRLGDTVTYSDPVHQEFSGIERPKISIGKDFPFERTNPFFRLGKFFAYQVFVRPFGALFCHLKFGIRIHGREKLRKTAGQGFFLYGNHTQVPADGFIPNLITFPKETHVIVNPDNLAAKGTRTIMQMLGALPTPTERAGFAGFEAAIASHIAKKRCVTVYPEAHIWPYAACIRPFPATSFHYPVKLNAPSYSFTVTYRRSKRGKPRIAVYVDGPFYGEGSRPKERQQQLRDTVYATMKTHADDPSNVAFVHYVPEETL